MKMATRSVCWVSKEVAFEMGVALRQRWMALTSFYAVRPLRCAMLFVDGGQI